MRHGRILGSFCQGICRHQAPAWVAAGAPSPTGVSRAGQTLNVEPAPQGPRHPSAGVAGWGDNHQPSDMEDLRGPGMGQWDGIGTDRGGQRSRRCRSALQSDQAQPEGAWRHRFNRTSFPSNNLLLHSFWQQTDANAILSFTHFRQLRRNIAALRASRNTARQDSFEKKPSPRISAPWDLVDFLLELSSTSRYFPHTCRKSKINLRHSLGIAGNKPPSTIRHLPDQRTDRCRRSVFYTIRRDRDLYLFETLHGCAEDL